MYRLTSPYRFRTLFAAAAAAAATATYSSRRCLADPPPSPATGEKVKPENDFKRKTLPPKLLSENVAMLTCESSADGGICNVYLVGTRHDSPESRREVKAVIEFLKPEVVFLELCPSRLSYQPELGTIRIAGGEMSEFFVAFDQAMKYGATVILGDRPIEANHFVNVAEKGKIRGYDGAINERKVLPLKLLSENVAILTCESSADGDKRMTANLSYWDFLKSEYYAVFQEKKYSDLWETRILPAVEEPLIHQRDQYMSAKILEVAHEHNSVVAVVGKAHLAGIQKNWKQPVELDRLLSLPAERDPFTTFIILNSVVVSAVGALAVTILRRLSKK